MDFASLPLSDSARTVLTELGHTRPTPIQLISIPLLVGGADVVGRSRTGSGKTAAFALPLLDRLDLRVRRPQALVLCPTRELGAQVATAIRTLGRRMPGVRVLLLCGGQPFHAQRQALHAGAHVIVATPGRLLDHLERGLELPDLGYVVLDEADRMLEMGFADAMGRIRAFLPADRQTTLFSATFPPTVDALVGDWLRDPVRVDADEPDAPIRQVACDVPPPQRVDALRAWLRHLQPGSALVFANYKASVQSAADALAAGGDSAAALHGDLEQRDREKVLAQFRNGSVRVLVATDVAARGLDVDGLDLVVNLELAPSPEVHLHRIGRTGRAGRPGLAVSFTRRAIEGAEAADVPRSSGEPLAAAMETWTILGGRRDKLRPGDVLGALTGEGGLTAADVGRIEVLDRVTYVAVRRGATVRLVRVKGRGFRIERA